MRPAHMRPWRSTLHLLLLAMQAHAHMHAHSQQHTHTRSTHSNNVPAPDRLGHSSARCATPPSLRCIHHPHSTAHKQHVHVPHLRSWSPFSSPSRRTGLMCARAPRAPPAACTSSPPSEHQGLPAPALLLPYFYIPCSCFNSCLLLPACSCSCSCLHAPAYSCMPNAWLRGRTHAWGGAVTLPKWLNGWNLDAVGATLLQAKVWL